MTGRRALWLRAAAAWLAVLALILSWFDGRPAEDPPLRLLLLDVSRSVCERPEEVFRRGLEELDSLIPGEGPLGILVFGAEPRLLIPPKDAEPSRPAVAEAIAALRALPDEFAATTRLDLAFEQAAALVRDRRARLVVVSDGRGREAAAEAEAALLATLCGTLESRPSLVEAPEDLRLEAPGQGPLIAGERNAVRVRVAGVVRDARDLVVQAGDQTLSARLDPDAPLELAFDVTPSADAAEVLITLVDAGGPDRWPGNDRLRLPISGRRRRVGILGKDAERSAARLEVEGPERVVLGLEGWPSAAQLRGLDALLLADWSLPSGHRRGEERLIRQVEESGLGLCVLGGAAAFRAGGYGSRARFDALLPLSSRVDRPRDLCLLLDRSGTMAQGDRLQRARHAILRLVERLEEGDRLRVVAFSDGVEAVGSDALLSPEAFASTVAPALASLVASGPTRVAGALEAALSTRWEEEGKRERLVILLSDLHDEALPDRIAALGARARKARVAVVVVLLEEKGAPDRSALAASLGRVVRARDLSPELLLPIVEGAGWRPGARVLKAHAGDEGVARLSGINPCVLGERARLLGVDADDEAPLFAVARRGAGRVVALAGALADDPGSGRLLGDLLLRVLPPQREELAGVPGADGRLWIHGRLPFGVAALLDGIPHPLRERAPGRFEGPPLAAIPTGLTHLELRSPRKGEERFRVPLMPRPDPEFEAARRPQILAGAAEPPSSGERSPRLLLLVAGLLLVLAFVPHGPASPLRPD